MPTIGGDPRRLVIMRRGGQGLLNSIAADPHQAALVCPLDRFSFPFIMGSYLLLRKFHVLFQLFIH